MARRHLDISEVSSYPPGRGSRRSSGGSLTEKRDSNHSYPAWRKIAQRPQTDRRCGPFERSGAPHLPRGRLATAKFCLDPLQRVPQRLRLGDRSQVVLRRLCAVRVRLAANLARLARADRLGAVVRFP